MTGAAAHARWQAWQRAAEVALAAKDYRHAHRLCMAILSEQPLFADAYFLLALLAVEHGNFAKALDVLDRALRLDPQRADFHAQRARCLLALSHSREATEAALHALQLGPASALAFDTIGVVLTRAGAQLEAVDPFRRATRLAPDNPAYRYNLAAALQFAGDFAGAEIEYRASLQLDPLQCRSWSALAQLRRDALTTDDIALLESWLHEGTLDVDGELHVRHALAKSCEDQSRYAESFAHLAAGKRRKHATVAGSAERNLELFATVRDVCTPQFCAEGDGDPSTEPIFIIGMPRTGTTLIERILSSHPDVFSAGELTNFTLTVKRATHTSSPYVLDRDTLLTARTLDFAAIGREYVESTRPRTGRTRHFIDKMPLNFFCAGLIHRALPQARIVCVRRNALDTCLANYRQLFATRFAYYDYAYDLLDIGRYYQQFDALMTHWRRTLGERFVEVQYEDVVTDTEREARRLLEFCGLPFTPDVLAFHQNASPVSTASSVQVRRPIYRTSVERWRKYESDLQPLIELLSER